MNKEQLKEAVGELNLVDTVFESDGVSYIDTAVSVMQVYDLIDQLDEPEKVVIPQFVADWWEGDSVTMYGGESINKKYKLRLISEFHDRGLGDYLSKAEDWLDENNSAFLDLVNGKPYEVEEEQKFYVLDKEDATLLKKSAAGEGVAKSVGTNIYNVKSWKDEEKYQLTEQEIKDYDERFWPFAVEVML